MSSLCWSQDSLTAYKEILLIKGQQYTAPDSVIVFPYMRAKAVFEDIAKLSEFKRDAIKLLATRDTTIANGKEKERELKEAIEKANEINDEKVLQIQSFERTLKNTRKKWIKITLYSSGGSVLAGLITGILIAK